MKKRCWGFLTVISCVIVNINFQNFSSKVDIKKKKGARCHSIEGQREWEREWERARDRESERPAILCFILWIPACWSLNSSPVHWLDARVGWNQGLKLGTQTRATSAPGGGICSSACCARQRSSVKSLHFITEEPEAHSVHSNDLPVCSQQHNVVPEW